MNGKQVLISDGFGIAHGMQMRTDKECCSKSFTIEFPKHDAIVEFKRQEVVGERIQELFFLRDKP